MASRDRQKRYDAKNKHKKSAYNRIYKAKNLQRIMAAERARRKAQREKAAGRPTPDACEVCGDGSRKICFDHDHKTGEFRGWLCSSCNRALGFAADSPGRLRALADYLIRVYQLTH